MRIAIENITVGTTARISALHFVGATDIQSAVNAQAKVLSISGTTIDFEASVGMRKTKSVIPRYATNSPPNIAQRVLNIPIFLPLFSFIIKFL